MSRFYIIIILFLIALILGIFSRDLFAKSTAAETRSPLTKEMVRDNTKPYHDCIRRETLSIMMVDQGKLKEKTAAHHTLIIVRQCDKHLSIVMKWLLKQGEPRQAVLNWGDTIRQIKLDKVFKYLQQGRVVGNKKK